LAVILRGLEARATRFRTSPRPAQNERRTTATRSTL
jgi:hypothetical protein